jgi:hypothetical protein
MFLYCKIYIRRNRSRLLGKEQCWSHSNNRRVVFRTQLGMLEDKDDKDLFHGALPFETGYMPEHKLLARKYTGWAKNADANIEITKLEYSNLVLENIAAKLKQDYAYDIECTLDSYFTSRTRRLRDCT